MIRNLSDLNAAKLRAIPPAAVPLGAAVPLAAVLPVPLNPVSITTKGFASSKQTDTAAAISVFPKALDVFTPPSENQPVLVADFLQMRAAVTAIKKAFLTIVKPAGKDLVKQCNRAYSQAGLPGQCSRYLGVKSSSLTSPVLVSIGASISVGVNTMYGTADVTLTAAQMAALGAVPTWSASGGIAVVTSAKLQVSTLDPLTVSPQSLAGNADCRIDDNGVIHFLLKANSGYLSPGTWYVYALLFRSVYNW